MKRWLFNIAALVSAVVMVGCVVLWTPPIFFDYSANLGRYELRTHVNRPTDIELSGRAIVHRPGIHFALVCKQQHLVLDAWYWYEPWDWDLQPLSFFLGTKAFGSGASITRVVVPHWFTALTFAILPSLWLYLRRGKGGAEKGRGKGVRNLFARKTGRVRYCPPWHAVAVEPMCHGARIGASLFHGKTIAWGSGCNAAG